MLAPQMISCLEYLHSKHFIHRDIKPDNFITGVGSKWNQIYLIDYGLAQLFEDPETLEHIDYKENVPVVGTLRYASINALSQIAQSRRDDLESLGYVLIYLIKGELPWSGISTDQGFKRLCEAKRKYSLEELCESLPEQFIQYFDAVEELEFQEKPNYSFLRNLFYQIMVNENYTFDYFYDWVEFRKRTDSTPTVDRHRKLIKENKISLSKSAVHFSKTPRKSAISKQSQKPIKSKNPKQVRNSTCFQPGV